jgi:hypothetical protein
MQGATVNKRKGPEFIRFMIPIINSLRELGGSGKAPHIDEFFKEFRDK